MQTIPRQIQHFILIVIASATLAIVVLADQVTWQDWQRLLLFFAITIVACSVRIPDPQGGQITPSDVLSYLAIYTFNPVTALLVVGAGRTIGFVISRGWIPWRAVLNGCQMALSVAIGAFVFELLGGVSQQVASGTLASIVAGPLAQQIANNFFYAYSFSRWRATPFFSTWINSIRSLFWPNLIHIPTAVFLAILYTEVHHATVITYLALLPFQWRALHLYLKRRQLYAQIVDGLVVATDVNFPLGRGHARRVADVAVAIAREMRLSEPMVESIQFAALLHDVGMIGKDDLLERPVVSAEDAEGLRDHVRVGAEIAKELPRKEIATMILRHHEKHDGTGYPDGLRGESIPLGARIIGLAEIIDSMVSGAFPFSSSVPGATIVSTVTAEKGHAFDPDVVDAFLRTIERGSVTVPMPTPRESEIARTPWLGESPTR